MLIRQKKLIAVSGCAISFLALSGLAMAENSATTADIEHRLSALESNSSASAGWTDRVEVSGVIEIEASYEDPDTGSSASDLVVATAELGISGTVTDSLSATVILLYEEDDGGIDVDVASLLFAPENSAFSLSLGQGYLPFGAYETALVNDTLALEMGETRETALTAYYQNPLFTGAVFIFNGDQDRNDQDVLSSFGGRLTVANDTYRLGVDYISNIADSDGLQENDYGYSTGEDAVAATTLYGSLTFGSISIMGEYLRVLDELAVDGLNSEPSAAQIEVAFNHGAMTYAASYQQTDEALFLELPETRVSVGVSRELAEGVGLAFQLQKDDDYSQGDGGSGDSINSAVLQLSAEF